jgi:ABC-2 type transport system permease protein
LPRLLASPLTPRDILAGKALACLITTVALIAFMLVVAAVVFGVRPTSIPLLALSTVAVAVGILGLMMIFSTFGKTEAAVSGISWAVIVVMAMIGGGMIPLMFIPAWLKPLTHISIVTWSIRALEGPLWRGSGAADLLLPWAVLLGIGVIGFLLGGAVYRRRVLG